jgi:hypothetical protein
VRLRRRRTSWGDRDDPDAAAATEAAGVEDESERARVVVAGPEPARALFGAHRERHRRGIDARYRGREFEGVAVGARSRRRPTRGRRR